MMLKCAKVNILDITLEYLDIANEYTRVFDIDVITSTRIYIFFLAKIGFIS